MEKYKASEQDIATMMMEHGFWLRVVRDLTPWRRELPRIRQACLDNALDSTRPDQADWMNRYERICRIGHGVIDDQEQGIPKKPKEKPANERIVDIGPRGKRR